MALNTWNDFSNAFPEMRRLERELNRMFHRFGGQERPVAAEYPAINAWEKGDSVYVEAELPGFERDELEIVVTSTNQLTINGRREAPEEKNGVWHRRERGFGRFSRVVTLPVDVNADKVRADLTNGVLTVALPKLQSLKPRKIEVKVSGN